MEKQRKATPFQALIFDFDGTLVDSMNLWDHLAGELLEKGEFRRRKGWMKFWLQ